jgi:hypothetical protein
LRKGRVSGEPLAGFDELCPEFMQLIDADPERRADHTNRCNRPVRVIDHRGRSGADADLPLFVLNRIAPSLRDVQVRAKHLTISDR